MADGPAVLLSASGDDALRVQASEPAATVLDEGAWAAANRCWTHTEPTGRGTATLPGGAWRFLPLRTARGRMAVLGIRLGDNPPAPRVQTLETLADQAAVALERVRLTGQAARAAAAEETQALRTALLNSLSHDLRTPLAGIRGAAGTLRGAWETLPEATRTDLLASIEDDTGRMTRFLANIMDLTRLESGQVRPRLAAVPLGEIIEAAIARVSGASFVPIGLPDPAPRVMADAALLEQAVVNVLDNAVKYAPPGSLPSIRVTQAGGEVAIAIADEGSGIPADDMPHIFDSFTRATRGDRVVPGTGLGLAIARGLVEAMGGTIGAQSPRPDVPADSAPGTIVTLRLPAA